MRSLRSVLLFALLAAAPAARSQQPPASPPAAEQQAQTTPATAPQTAAPAQPASPDAQPTGPTEGQPSGSPDADARPTGVLVDPGAQRTTEEPPRLGMPPEYSPLGEGTYKQVAAQGGDPAFGMYALLAVGLLVLMFFAVSTSRLGSR